MEPDRPDVIQRINQPWPYGFGCDDTASHSQLGSEDGDATSNDQLETFAKQFKQKRIKLG